MNHRRRARSPIAGRMRVAAMLMFALALEVSRSTETAGQSNDASNVAVDSMEYALATTRDGRQSLYVDVYRVPGRAPRGAVVLMHGGSFVSGSRGIAENREYGEALARRGYVAAAISYRLVADEPVIDAWATRYADVVRNLRDARIAAAIEQFGPRFPNAVAAAAVDLKAAVEWLRRSAPELGYDADDIALFGASAGAITALTTAYTMEGYGASDLDVAAVIDLRGFMIVPETAGNPFDADAPPLMLLHGESDDRVPLADAERVFDLARRGGTPVEFYTAPGFGHELGGSSLLLLRIDQEESVLDRIDTFLASAFSGTAPRRSLRGRLLVADAPALVSESVAAASDSLFRQALSSAVSDLRELVRLDDGFVAGLYGISKAEALLRPFDDVNRLDWSYWPRDRRGLAVAMMNAAQREQTQRILRVFLSSKGYLQVNHIMLLEEFLAGIETQGFARGTGDYVMSIFGEPAPEGRWALRFEGHHVSLNVTVGEERISVTPSFLGASPAPIPTGLRTGFNPLEYEQRYAHDLMKSLDEAQLGAALLSDRPPIEVLTTQFQVDSAEWLEWRSRLARDGILASTFDANQLQLLHRVMSEIVSAYRPEVGVDWLNALDLRTVAFAWMGSTEPGQPHYFRLQGRDFVFELDAAQGGGSHIHAVWRDRRSDFGGDTLTDHYRRHAHR